jgi:DNA-binding SARP family transcriptional activator
MGRYADAVANLEKAAKFWSDPPTSPFADNSELVVALIGAGRIDRARAVAAEAVQRTSPWRRPNADALFGQAAVQIAEGRHDAAIEGLHAALGDPAILGALHGLIVARLIEALVLANAGVEQVADAHQHLLGRPIDPRYLAEITAARALATHISTRCAGDCLAFESELDAAEAMGASGTAVKGRVKVGILRLAHHREPGKAWLAVEAACDAGLAPGLRWWLRRYAPHAKSALRLRSGARLLTRLVASDPDGWRDALVHSLQTAKGSDRPLLIDALSRYANRATVEGLRQVRGDDVSDLRRHLQHIQATRLFLRTLGGVSLHRSDWNGPALDIDKKRVRTLLALLAARAHTTLTRDMAIDTLWPATDADAAVNSLNQTVFQLRRYIDPAYRGGESPEYVISTSEQVALNPELVHTDLEEIRRLPAKATGDWKQRQASARRAIALVRGEFLADLRYEEWTTVQQVSVHTEIRERLMPIALSAGTSYEVDVAISAAMALTCLDPFDEGAVIALAKCLADSGRRVAARDVIIDFARRMSAEIDDEPSPNVIEAARLFGASAGVKRTLTEPSGS